MKAVVVLSWIEMILTVCGILSLIFVPEFSLWKLFLSAAFGIWCAVLFLACRQKNIMRFLIAENKKKNAGKEKNVYWNEEENRKLEMMKKRVELYTLQSQINPHFLYNTLDSIRGRALLDGNREIASMTEVLSRFFRYCISCDESLVKLREEISHIRDYYYIQKYRFEDRFDMEIEIEGDEVYEYYLPRMTLQPLVENAMIHGLEKVNRKGLLKIRCIATEKKMVLTVSDNGAGMDIEQLDKLNRQMEGMLFAGKKRDNHSGIAVSNVNARMKMTFGEEYGVRYRSMENVGTDVEVLMPIVDDFTRVRYEEQIR